MFNANQTNCSIKLAHTRTRTQTQTQTQTRKDEAFFLETLERRVAEERNTLEALRSESVGCADPAGLAKDALYRGKALQRFVLTDVSEAMPDAELTEPVIASLITTANDFVRIGLMLRELARKDERLVEHEGEKRRG